MEEGGMLLYDVESRNIIAQEHAELLRAQAQGNPGEHRARRWLSERLIAAAATPPLTVPTPPEIFLQVAQWQKDMFRNSSGSSKRTPPHWQLPRNIAMPRA